MPACLLFKKSTKQAKAKKDTKKKKEKPDLTNN
jgi:hypothetical protein